MCVLLGVVVCLAVASAQMCQNSGHECFTHSDCCGGCCRSSVCIDSTRECTTEDDCSVYYCPGGFSCSLYQTPGCPGCQIVRYCRPSFLNYPIQEKKR